MGQVGECDAVIKAAAVADYRPLERTASKVKKQAAELTLHLTRNADILAELGSRDERPSWSARATNRQPGVLCDQEAAREDLDMIVANDVSQSDAGFNVETNRALLLFRDGRRLGAR